MNTGVRSDSTIDIIVAVTVVNIVAAVVNVVDGLHVACCCGRSSYRIGAGVTEQSREPAAHDVSETCLIDGQQEDDAELDVLKGGDWGVAWGGGLVTQTTSGRRGGGGR